MRRCPEVASYTRHHIRGHLKIVSIANGSVRQRATTAQRTLKLGLVLNNKSLVLVVNRLGELCGDGVVSGLVLEHETLVALDPSENSRLLNRPGPNVLPFFLRVLLLGM